MSDKSDVSDGGLTCGSLAVLADGSFVSKVEQSELPAASEVKGHGGDVGVLTLN
ncbi:hypothetical protein [Enterococcus faecalis]|uniref:hypothetical protein n=1 Tax=Enterococcus faecalis TaxID=1351 RepID=UPI001F512131|nr:hypothetical protein [Enterococcus faecalis]MCI0139917.1 hypothetical protein [Enterococcus faecalis]